MMNKLMIIPILCLLLMGCSTTAIEQTDHVASHSIEGKIISMGFLSNSFSIAPEHESFDELVVNTRNSDIPSRAKVGDTVVIGFDGSIMESDPPQVHALSIERINE
ncbi:hypothetical protein [Geomicrobium sp. JCM 19055]|uniref:hypothetical protein n=1 Tax=Geomicrobium sp. JCM 19055 TaxID=1460649 RepID=UPI00045ED2E9|nr:hypothetical protein [Geomicrobium sp. JCM 19055]GAJ98905.1 hypothetical protein JCM19055_1869 [Geomicrobium sp. JCM 19055]